MGCGDSTAASRRGLGLCRLVLAGSGLLAGFAFVAGAGGERFWRLAPGLSEARDRCLHAHG